MRKFAIIAVTLVALFSFGRTAFAFYFFGGRILNILAPYPAGPCHSKSIVVGPPNPGIFVLPAGKLYSFFSVRPGVNVLGTASGFSCGTIFYMGTSFK